MSDYRVSVKVQNNNILKMIERAGYKSVGEFCRLNNKPNWASSIGEFVNIKRAPLSPKGEFYPIIFEMCEILNCSPEDLFNETQLQAAIESNKRTLEVNEAEMKFMMSSAKQEVLLEDELHMDRLPATIDKVLDTLMGREKTIIEMRFGLKGERPLTLSETASQLKVTPERIRQIELKCLRKLRHPSRSKDLKEFAID